MPDPPGTQWLTQQTQDKQFDTDPSYQTALKKLKLTPQEQYMFKHHLGNLYRGGVKQPGGQISTYLGTTFGLGKRTYMLPTVWDNMIVDAEEGLKRAKAAGIDKWPSYKNEKEAEKRYQQIHKYMEANPRYQQPEQPNGDPVHQ
jgi:hypothetical protein